MPYEDQFRRCDEHLKALTTLALTHKNPKRPCSFFHYTGLTRERLANCISILERMDSQRVRLNSLDRRLDRAHQELGEWPAGTPYPENIQLIMRAEGKLENALKLDFETLYLFGMMLLDQWALIAKCVGGLTIPKVHPFNEVVQVLEAGNGPALQPHWTARSEQFLWLFHNFRVFRNVFVAHSVEAWQRGTSRAVHGMTFTMFMPSPPEHRRDEEATNQEINGLLHLAPAHIRNAPEDYWERARPARLLEVLFDNIGNIPTRDDRLKVEKLFKRRGGSTPTYQTVGARLLNFCENGLKDLLDLMQGNPDSLNLEYVEVAAPNPRGSR